MVKLVAVGLLAFISLAPAAWAATCGSLTTFTSGQTALASAVNNNFTTLNTCIGGLAPLASPSFTGSVGIGTTTAATTLDVRGTIESVGANASGTLPTISSTISAAGGTLVDWNGLSTQPGESDFINVFRNGANTAGGGFAFFNMASTTAVSTTPLMFINTLGDVMVGTVSPSYLFTVNGSAGGTSAWQTISDERLKKNIEPISNALELVQRLRPVRYHWRAVHERKIGKTLSLATNEPQIGFLAQEVAAVIPEAAVIPKKGSNEPYGLKEDNLIPVLVEAVKEQQAEIEALRATVASLKSGGSGAQ